MNNNITPERIMQFAWGYAPTLIIQSALQHRIFDLLDESPKTVDELALATTTSKRGLTAILNALVAIYIFTLVPEFLMRFIVWIWVHTFYRLKKINLDSIPGEGPAILICNHVSFVDALVIFAACPRPVRFVMDHGIFKIPLLSFIFRTARAIPIASRKEDPAITERAFEEVDQALAQGDIVCIFPEGKITATGDINPFRPGITRILERRPVPVIPLAVRGLWGSFFSRKSGTAMRIPRGILSRIELAAGPAVVPRDATPEKLQAIVTALRGDWR